MPQIETLHNSLSKVHNIILCQWIGFHVVDSSRSSCYTFAHGTHKIGLIRPDIWKHLKGYDDVFCLDEKSSTICLSPHLDTVEKRSSAFENILEQLRAKDVFVSLRGWRNEVFTKALR